MIFYAPGIGYQDYIQVLPSFNNYFGQRVMNFGFRNLKDGSGPGTCESAYLWSPPRCALPLTSDPCDKYIGSHVVYAFCGNNNVCKYCLTVFGENPNYHFVDNCNLDFKPNPWHKFPFGGCQCECVPK